MKTLIIAVCFTVLLSGCATIQNWIPSFWDDNQSARIVDIRQSIEQITCEPGSQLGAAQRVASGLEWFRLYSESKGTRQQDVLRITQPMEDTVADWIKRSETKEGSKSYCELKKRTLKLQAERAAQAILGRF
jgi:hypothetical protein